MANVDVGFQLVGDKGFLVRGENRKEIPREIVLEIYQLCLGCIAPNRDYSSVSSSKKLLRIIDLECEPDESEDEANEPEPEPVKKSAPKAAKAVPAKKAPAAKKSTKKAAPKTAPVTESDSGSDNGSGSGDSGSED